MDNSTAVQEHYDNHTLVENLCSSLERSGLGDKTLSATDLAPLDQFHSRGLAATIELAAILDIKSDTTILDVGSGLGGPSRYLASTFGCHVIGIDLSPTFVDAANFLADRSGIADRLTYKCADALALPFEASSFDIVWTQHVAMNIFDRAVLYSEAYRVLRPGGHLAIYDITAGDGRPVHFPVPWSRFPETSYLTTPDEMRNFLTQQGFQVKTWEDCTESGIKWFAELKKVQAEIPPSSKALGLHVVMGPEFKDMVANLALNMEEGRIGIIQAVLEKPRSLCVF